MRVARHQSVFKAQVAKTFDTSTVRFLRCRLFYLVADQFVVRHGPAVVARVSGMCAVIGLILVVGFASAPLTIFGFVLMGIGYASIIPLAFSRAAADADKSPGEAIAAVATLGHGAYLLGAPAIGLIAEASSLRVAFGLLGILAFMIALLAPVLRTDESEAGIGE